MTRTYHDLVSEARREVNSATTDLENTREDGLVPGVNTLLGRLADLGCDLVAVSPLGVANEGFEELLLLLFLTTRTGAVDERVSSNAREAGGKANSPSSRTCQRERSCPRHRSWAS